MKSPTLEDRRQLWGLAYARSSFEDARAFATALLGLGPQDGSLRKGLTIAMCSAYSRPFKQRDVGRLGVDIVPKEFLETHKNIITYRDQVISHRDLDGPVASWGFVSELVIDWDGKSVGLHTLSPIAEPELVKNVKRLSGNLIDLLDQRIAPIIARIRPCIEKPGRFVLNLKGSGPWSEPRDVQE